MIRATVLLDIADDLAVKDPNPSQEHLRRAVSTIYYAMFHALCKLCADSLVGPENAKTPAWKNVYRALDHRVAKQKCEEVRNRGLFGTVIKDFATSFCQLQPKRHKADYDPHAKISREELLVDLMVAGFCINRLRYVQRRRRREFAIHLLIKARKE